MKSESRGRSVLSGGHKKSGSSKHKTHGIHVRRGKSGGFVLKHDPAMNDETGMTEQDEHVSPDMSSMLAHLQDHFSDQPAVAPPPPAAPDPGAGQPTA